MSYTECTNCDLYSPVVSKNEIPCRALTEVHNWAEKPCPFFKTKPQALEDRCKSILRRQRLGIPLPSQDLRFVKDNNDVLIATKQKFPNI